MPQFLNITLLLLLVTLVIAYELPRTRTLSRLFNAAVFSTIVMSVVEISSNVIDKTFLFLAFYTFLLISLTLIVWIGAIIYKIRKDEQK